ncbi:MAG: type IV secretory system conjugative DNA transfer family protein, partial [Coriobacteriales bacterium]
LADADVTSPHVLDGDEEAAGNMAASLGTILCPSPDGAGENAWCYTDAAAALGAYIFEVATAEIPSEKKHLYSVAKGILSMSDDSGSALREHFRSSGSDTVAMLASAFTSAADRQMSSIISTLLAAVSPFATSSMRYLTGASDISIPAMLEPNSNIAVFIRTLEPSNPRQRIASAFVETHLQMMVRRGARRGACKTTWVLADEMASFKFNVVYGLQQGRKYGWHIYMWFQDCSNSSMWNIRDALLSNCDVKALFRAGTNADAELFSALSGCKTVAMRTQGESDTGCARSMSESMSESKQPVWEPGELVMNDPRQDGIYVISTIAGNPRCSGLFEGVPIADISETPAADRFSFGSPGFEAEVIARAVDDLRASALSKDRTVPFWVPDSPSCDKAQASTVEACPDLFMD